MDLLKRSKLSPSILAEIKKLHFQTRRLADQAVLGSYRSAFRGTGIEFEDVREYTPGDDVRRIDWRVTARKDSPYIKSYREERELSVMLAVDVSSSTITGTRKRLREQLIAQTGAVLTLIALQNNDNVGLVTYSDKLETYHPARKARGAVWRILHEVLDPNRQGQTTDISGLCRFLSRVLKRRAIVFLLSDFADNDFQQELTLLSKRHDVTAISVSDPFDFELPDSGLLALQDAETGKSFTIDSSHRKIRELYATRAREAHEKLNKCFISSNVSWLPLQTDRDYMRELRRYFHFRQQRYRA